MSDPDERDGMDELFAEMYEPVEPDLGDEGTMGSADGDTEADTASGGAPER
jgi:hypothetical protein